MLNYDQDIDANNNDELELSVKENDNSRVNDNLEAVPMAVQEEDPLDSNQDNDKVSESSEGAAPTKRRSGRVIKPAAVLQDDDFNSFIPKVKSKVNAFQAY